MANTAREMIAEWRARKAAACVGEFRGVFIIFGGESGMVRKE